VFLESRVACRLVPAAERRVAARDGLLRREDQEGRGSHCPGQAENQASAAHAVTNGPGRGITPGAGPVTRRSVTGPGASPPSASGFAHVFDRLLPVFLCFFGAGIA